MKLLLAALFGAMGLLALPALGTSSAQASTPAAVVSSALGAGAGVGQPSRAERQYRRDRRDYRRSRRAYRREQRAYRRALRRNRGYYRSGRWYARRSPYRHCYYSRRLDRRVCTTRYRYYR